ncbi:putative oxalyl-CoA decarboxylase [Helianthus anomalus]
MLADWIFRQGYQFIVKIANKLLDDAEKNRYIEPLKSVSNDDIAKVILAIRKAERPLIVFGKGAAIAMAENEIKDLVEKMGILFFPTPMGKDLLPDTHELAATSARSLAIGKCDFTIVLKDVKFILIDVNEGEIELQKPYLVLNKEITDDPFCLGRTHLWIEAITNKVKENESRMEGQLAKEVVSFNFLTPMRIILDVIIGFGSLAPILVSEGANTMDVGWSVLVQTEP